MSKSRLILGGDLLDFSADPATDGESAVNFEAKGGLLIEDGIIKKRGAFEHLVEKYGRSAEVHYFEDKLLIPGLIDTHVHFPQTEMIAAYGEQLLTWLTEHAFPTEEQYSDIDHARAVADVFLGELLRNGTTTALVFGTVHPESVEAFFQSAQKQNLRMIAGKVMMDRNCPPTLQDTAESSYVESKELIEKWHGTDRLSYAVTPRFAPTSTPAQLEACSRLMEEYPDVYMHTHVSENTKECEWVSELFPDSEDYVGVYEDAGLLRKRSVLAHGIHLSDRELCCLEKNETAIAHCPTSNLFIGSGLFNLKSIKQHDINVGMGSDVGAGTSFSLLQTFNEAYKVQQLQGNNLTAFDGLYMSTLGGARALDLEGTVGQLQPGCEADLVVLDPYATPLMDFRLRKCNSLHEKLFGLMMLGDDRAVYQTYSFGKLVHQRERQ